MTVKVITDAILAKTGAHIPSEHTCDQLVTGSFDAEVKGIVSTFMVTLEVLQKAVEIGANLIVTHEPTLFFEKRMPMTDPFLENNPVYFAKKKLIEENEINIWRFHDHMHAETDKDGIYRGFEKELDWGKYFMVPEEGSEFARFGGCYEIPEVTLRELCEFYKSKLHMNGVRIVGDPEMKVHRVGVLVGGGSQGLGNPFNPLKVMEARDLQVIVCGEIMELLTAPYIKEMNLLGYDRAMLILGHERSEEAGMKYLGEWMAPFLQGAPVTFIDSKDPFDYI